jgi:hypothetical protein
MVCVIVMNDKIIRACQNLWEKRMDVVSVMNNSIMDKV